MRYRDRVLLQLREPGRGSLNQKELVDTGDPVPLKCNVYPISVDEQQFYGRSAGDVRKLFCRSWPGNLDTIVTFEGDVWDVEPAQPFGAGRNTRHVEVVIKRRTGFRKPTTV